MTPPRRSSDQDAALVVRRLTIEAPFVHQCDAPMWTNAPVYVEPSAPLRLRNVAELLAGYFRREGRYDFRPYHARRPDGQTVALLPFDGGVSDGVLVAGAVGLLPTTAPVAGWVWVHPMARGTRLVDRHWPYLTARCPGLVFGGPYTPAGLALATRLAAVEARSDTWARLRGPWTGDPWQGQQP